MIIQEGLMSHQSASSCLLAGVCIVVRRTRCRAVSVDCLVVVFVGSPPAPLSGLVTVVGRSILERNFAPPVAHFTGCHDLTLHATSRPDLLLAAPQI